MPQTPSLDRVILFCRYPIPGRTKTRLIPALGPYGAAELHRKLTENTMKIISQTASDDGIDVAIHFEGASEDRMRMWLGKPAEYYAQQGKNLGDRMFSAFQEAFENGSQRVVLVGSDLPELKSIHLKSALKALENYDLVLGPSTDGGYWLIGLTKPADIFAVSNWGGDSVLDQTIALVQEQNLSYRLLDTLSDIDTPEDLIEWNPDFSVKTPYLSVIVPTLNEAENIEKCLSLAKKDEVEMIVVDGGSTDQTRKLAQKAGALVLESPLGRPLQLNTGAEKARGDVLLFLHADTILPDDYMKHIFFTLQDKETIAGAFRFKTDLEGPIMRITEHIVNVRAKRFQLPYGDQGFFIRKIIFEEAGRFPDVPIAEDLYFVRSLTKKGRIGIAPVEAITSARRWRQKGFTRTTLINYAILIGCLFGIKPEKLAALY